MELRVRSVYHFGVVGIVLLALLWKAPADGYEKADKILDEARREYGNA